MFRGYASCPNACAFLQEALWNPEAGCVSVQNCPGTCAFFQDPFKMLQWDAVRRKLSRCSQCEDVHISRPNYKHYIREPRSALFQSDEYDILKTNKFAWAGNCATYHCYKGGPAEPPEGLLTNGCPLHSHPAQLTDNADCVLCMECLKASWSPVPLPLSPVPPPRPPLD